MNIYALVIAVAGLTPGSQDGTSLYLDTTFTYTSEIIGDPYEKIISLAHKKLSEKYGPIDFNAGLYVDPEWGLDKNDVDKLIEQQEKTRQELLKRLNIKEDLDTYFMPRSLPSDIDLENLDLTITKDTLNRELKITGSELEVIDGFIAVECNPEDLP